MNVPSQKGLRTLVLCVLMTTSPVVGRAADPVFFASAPSLCNYFKAKRNGKPISYTYPGHQKYGKGDTFVVFVDGRTVDKVKIQEAERNSQLTTDLESLLKQWLGGPVDCGGAQLEQASVTLQYPRSTLTLTAMKASAVVEKTTVLTGPDEHWRLSVDLPVTNRKTLKYDSATGTLQSTENNPQLYVGFDYQLGDILSPPQRWLTKDRLVVKALFLASSKPLNSMGVAIGYTLPSIHFWKGEGLGPVSLFVGRFWTKQDAIVNGVARTDYSYKGSWRIGISYNLSDMINKLKF